MNASLPIFRDAADWGTTNRVQPSDERHLASSFLNRGVPESYLSNLAGCPPCLERFTARRVARAYGLKADPQRSSPPELFAVQAATPGSAHAAANPYTEERHAAAVAYLDQLVSKSERCQ